MLYVGIDLHLKQLTVCIRDEQGNITRRRQVSTRPAQAREFLDELGRHEAGYVVMLEVCGFHDWLVRKLREEAACRDYLSPLAPLRGEGSGVRGLFAPVPF